LIIKKPRTWETRNGRSLATDETPIKHGWEKTLNGGQMTKGWFEGRSEGVFGPLAANMVVLNYTHLHAFTAFYHLFLVITLTGQKGQKSGVRSQNGTGEKTRLGRERKAAGWHPKTPLFPPSSGYFRQFRFFSEPSGAGREMEYWSIGVLGNGVGRGGSPCAVRESPRKFTKFRTEQGGKSAMLRIVTGEALFSETGDF
jgi:hypothetical protein